MKENHAGKESKNIPHAQRLMKIHEGFPLIYIPTQIVFTSLGCEADYSSSASHQKQKFQFPPARNENDTITSAYFIIIVTSNHHPLVHISTFFFSFFFFSTEIAH